MKKTILCVLFLTTLTASAQTIVTPTVNNCGKWNKVSMLERMEAKAWLMGYLSAFNSVAPRNISEYVDVLKLTDSDTVESAVDLYCKNNPYQTLQDAANSVYGELRKRAKPR